MVLSELLAALRSEGLVVRAHHIHHGISAGHLPRPERDGSGRFRFSKSDLGACRRYAQNIPRPGRKKAATES